MESWTIGIILYLKNIPRPREIKNSIVSEGILEMLKSSSGLVLVFSVAVAGEMPLLAGRST
jgi:hypothetical protein